MEWNDVDGTIKRVYDGLSKRSTGVIHFDLSKNKYIAVGDEFMVKFWNMNSPSVLTSTDAKGGLEVTLSFGLVFSFSSWLNGAPY